MIKNKISLLSNQWDESSKSPKVAEKLIQRQNYKKIIIIVCNNLPSYWTSIKMFVLSKNAPAPKQHSAKKGSSIRRWITKSVRLESEFQLDSPADEASQQNLWCVNYGGWEAGVSALPSQTLVTSHHMALQPHARWYHPQTSTYMDSDMHVQSGEAGAPVGLWGSSAGLEGGLSLQWFCISIHEAIMLMLEPVKCVCGGGACVWLRFSAQL